MNGSQLHASASMEQQMMPAAVAAGEVRIPQVPDEQFGYYEV